MQLYLGLVSKETLQRSMELLNMEWDDFDDFLNKYDSEVNIEDAAKRYSSWLANDGLGYLLYHDLIDEDMAYWLGGSGLVRQWYKWEPIIEEYRKRLNDPELCFWFEYYVTRMKKLRDEKDLPEVLTSVRS